MTLSERRLIGGGGEARTERELPDEATWQVVLRERFGIDPAV